MFYTAVVYPSIQLKTKRMENTLFSHFLKLFEGQFWLWDAQNDQILNYSHKFHMEYWN